MKAFERWAAKKKKQCHSQGQSYYSSDYKTGWREALRWVVQSGMDHYGDDFLVFDLYKAIREELGE